MGAVTRVYAVAVTKRYQLSTLGGDGRNNDGHDKSACTVRDKGQDKLAGTIRDKGQYKAAGTVRKNTNRSNRSEDGDIPGGAANKTYKLADNGERNAGGGVKSSTNSGTI
jgi:hypothetical protein